MRFLVLGCNLFMVSPVESDPTLDFLQRIEDPTRWVVIRDAPICIPHEREIPGKGEEDKPQRIVVTEDDLPEIAYQLGMREATYGVLPVMTLGHRQQSDPKFPETQQPPIVGFAKDAKVGKFGPMQIPCVTATLYYNREDWDEAKKYPFRSMDFYPGTKKVTGVALLKRDPFLPLGMVTYQSPTSNIRLGAPVMATEDKEKDDKKDGEGKKEEETPRDDASEGEVPGEGTDEEQIPEGHEEWRKHLDYAMKKHPVLYGMACKYAAAQSGQGGGETTESDHPSIGTGKESYDAANRIGRAAQAMSPVGRTVGAMNQLRKGNVGAAIGDVTGVRPWSKAAFGEYEDTDVSIQYQQLVDKRFAVQEQERVKLAKQIAALQAKEAQKDSELLVYQLVNAGVKALHTKDGLPDMAKIKEFTGKLSKMDEKSRKSFAEEVQMYWEKDASIPYSAMGAPVGGGFVSMPTPMAQMPGEPKFTQAHLDKANDYLTKHPGVDWDKACEYALNGKVVTG